MNISHNWTQRRRRPVRAAVAVAVALAGVAITACQPDDQQTSPPSSQPASGTATLPFFGAGEPGIDRSVDAEVIDYLVDNNLPGATLAVTRGSRLVWSKGYGFANRDYHLPMQPRHRSKIGSVSKLITAIGAFQLVEQGMLDLDEPIYGDPGPFRDNNTTWPPADKGDWVRPWSVLDRPERYWSAMLDGVRVVTPNKVNNQINTYRDWASRITVRHLLSHTAGYLRSGGSMEEVDDHYGKPMRDYRGHHTYVLSGERTDSSGNRLAPLVFEPGTEWRYSNHGFGLLGHIIQEASGGREYYGYYDHTKTHILDPLGLTDVVPNNTRIDDGLDAWPHGGSLDADRPARFQSTGGWSASATDLARIMCGIDQTSNIHRLLDRDTVAVMHSIPFPEADSNRPHGWDVRTGGYERYKNGRLAGGTSVVMKFLPGRFDDAPDDEINVAIAINASASDDAVDDLAEVLRSIAAEIASADIDVEYDLFDPEYRCRVDGPTVTILAPGDGAEIPLGTEVMFEAEARDATGEPLAVTWTMPGGSRTTQPDARGRHATFHDSLPLGTHTIGVTATDSGGHEAYDGVSIEVTHDAPDVVIVNPADGETVWAGEPLDLVGQSTQGFLSLPDDHVSWELIRGGETVDAGSGHERTVPGSVLAPGVYTIVFTGHDGYGFVDDSVTITAEDKPEHHPTATITAPAAASVHPVAGNTAEITFSGTAVDGDGTAIDGTNYRWTASWAGGDDIELCSGTNTPDAGQAPGGDPGGIAAVANCASFTAELAGHHIAGHTNYTVRLEVWNADGNRDEATTSVRVFIPPVG